MSTDLGFIISQITQLISKWIKYDIQKHFKDYITPSKDKNQEYNE